MKETGHQVSLRIFAGASWRPFPGFEELNAARQELRRLGLLGVDESGVGFGNVSLRDGATDSFYITGSGTGALSALALQDYAKVVAWDFERNWLRCEGRVIASAESLTHAAVYSMDAEVRVVVHGHDRCLWQGLRERGAATARMCLTARPRWRGRFSGCFEKPMCAPRSFSRWPGTRMGLLPLVRTSARRWPRWRRCALDPMPKEIHFTTAYRLKSCA